MRGLLNIIVILMLFIHFGVLVMQVSPVNADGCSKVCRNKAKNDKCDSECNIKECDYDGGECTKSPTFKPTVASAGSYDYDYFDFEYIKIPSSTLKPTTKSPTFKPTKPTSKPTYPTHKPTKKFSK